MSNELIGIIGATITLVAVYLAAMRGIRGDVRGLREEVRNLRTDMKESLAGVVTSVSSTTTSFAISTPLRRCLRSPSSEP